MKLIFTVILIISAAMCHAKLTVEEYLNQNVTYPYYINEGPGAGNIKYVSGPANKKIIDLVRDEMTGSRLKRGDDWYLINRLKYSRELTGEEYKLGEYLINKYKSEGVRDNDDEPDAYHPNPDSVALMEIPDDEVISYYKQVKAMHDAAESGAITKRGDNCSRCGL